LAQHSRFEKNNSEGGPVRQTGLRSKQLTSTTE